MISDNALYYTFSTIAQTLAAGFGVVAVFAVFRLPLIEQHSEHQRLRRYLIRYLGIVFKVTAADIGICVASLPLVPWLSKYHSSTAEVIAWIAAGTAIVLGVVFSILAIVLLETNLAGDKRGAVSTATHN